ncbi:ATP-binding cassette domain-containing protein [Microvirga massiliensis]|uniref:thiamine ABC transporter ATP-binding protein n=1 Tax=Microvirga massiliensis TaxID=1033741 RepID=UPI00062B6899|nr:ATP-binding cassette domain-containing protein [Microvirga massiliensis]
MLVVDDCRLEYPDFSARYSLRVDAGRLCAIVGPSGGGKTTLLHLIAGFERPVSGSLYFARQDLLPLRPALRPIAMVFQDHNLFPHLTAAENVALGLRPSLRLDDRDRRQVADALDAVDLTGLADRRPGEMSGGQGQRVALARALVTRKPLLLLDEPFGGLDPGLRRNMIRLVDDLRRRRSITVVLTIHTPEDIVEIADQAAFVAGGQVIAEGSPSEVLTAGRDPRIAAFLG